MTYVSGHDIIATPCCGKQYSEFAYGSINFCDLQRWSDGFWFARLYHPRENVCHCACGSLILASDAAKIGYRRFRDRPDDGEALEMLPRMRHFEIASWLLKRWPFPNQAIETEMRTVFWQALNHFRRELCVRDQGHTHTTPARSDAAFREGYIGCDTELENLTEQEMEFAFQDNLAALIPLLEAERPNDHFLIAEAYRESGQRESAVRLFQACVDQEENRAKSSRGENGDDAEVRAKQARRLLHLSKGGESEVIRLEPPDWVAPPRKPRPRINHDARGEIVSLRSRDYWFAVDGMLQQVWILLEQDDQDGSVIAYKIHDDSFIYGQQWFSDETAALTYLLFNGYRRFDQNPEVWEILTPPGGPFHLRSGVSRMKSPRQEVQELIADGLMPIRWHACLDEDPELPAPVDLDNKIAGLLLGLAIGDALGNTSESLLPSTRRQRYGWITGYLPNRHAHGQPLGLPSDDTQMAFWTLEHLLNGGKLDPPQLAQAFSTKRIYGIGQSVKAFLRAFKSGTDWTRAGATSAGNGALMRIAPVLLPHLADPSPALWLDVLRAAHLTHRDALSNVACLAFADLLWQWLGEDDLPDASTWLNRFADMCSKVEPETCYRPRAGHPPGFNGTLSEMIRAHLIPALEQDLSVLDACTRWHSGAYLLETVPCVLYILAKLGHDPEAAILAAVNDTKDNDTIAAIVGTAVGALHGLSKFPPAWHEGLIGRLGSHDDGRVMQLTTLAVERFGYGADPVSE